MRRNCKGCECVTGMVDGGVVGVAEERKCKVCVCNRGGPTPKCYTHTSYTFSFCGHTKSTHKYNIDVVPRTKC